jgi:FKBP-type peptidyl-prolyl cis-trans isomerase FkpA
MPILSVRQPVAALAVALAASLSIGASGARAQQGAVVTTPTGVQMIDQKVGTGVQPKKGQTVVVDYTGWLYQNGAKGAKFDSSLDRGYPFMFKLGTGQVIQGWDDGVASMKVGGKRTLIIPPNMGYGTRGAGESIPPNATLMFDVELLDVKE